MSENHAADLGTIPRSPRLERLIGRVTLRLGLNNIHCVGAFKVKAHEAYTDADLVHFHGIHSQFFSYLALPSLTANKPAIFTIRDMWPLTGHCAVNYDCERWKVGCGQCPYPDAPPALPTQRDMHLTSSGSSKIGGTVNSRLTVVSLSRRLTEQAQQSILDHFPIHHIPNGVDTEAYRPLDPHQCRSVFDIPAKRKRADVDLLVLLKRQHKGHRSL